MPDANAKRLKGLTALLRDGVVEGANAIERVHRATAKRPFDILKAIPPLRAPTAGVEAVHDAVVSVSYASVRAVTGVVSGAAELAIDLMEPEQSAAEPEDDSAG